MSHANDPSLNRSASTKSDDADSPHTADALPQRVAHEMANLLDGSLRNLGLAIHCLKEPLESDRELTSPGDVELLQRLETTNHALKQMSALVAQLRGGAAMQAGFANGQTLSQAIHHAVGLLKPFAESSKTVLRVCLQSSAADQPVGPLYPVILNLLKNSIEAIAVMPERDDMAPVVEINAHLVHGSLELTIRDNGPGLAPELMDQHGAFRFGATTKPQGLGVGLQLARETAESLGGAIDIGNVQPHGALLTLRLPTPA